MSACAAPKVGCPGDPGRSKPLLDGETPPNRGVQGRGLLRPRTTSTPAGAAEKLRWCTLPQTHYRPGLLVRGELLGRALLVRSGGRFTVGSHDARRFGGRANSRGGQDDLDRTLFAIPSGQGEHPRLRQERLSRLRAADGRSREEAVALAVGAEAWATGAELIFVTDLTSG